MAQFSGFFSNYANNSRSNNGALPTDLMSNAVIVPSLNSGTPSSNGPLGHLQDGFIYLSNLLIQFSATTDPSSNLSNGNTYQLYYPISSKPYCIYVTGLTNNNAIISIVPNTIHDASCNVRIGNANGALYWLSIGPAPTTPIYTNIISSNIVSSSSYLQAVTLNSTGQIQYYCGGLPGGLTTGYIYKNINYGYGNSTLLSSSTSNVWTSICTDSSGTYVYATNAPSSGGYVYYSSNGGSSFTQSTSQLSSSWKSITCSNDGRYVYAVINSGGIYYSNNYGVNFTVSNAPNKAWYSIATNNTGNIVFACINATSNGGIYISTDYGQTWSITSANTTIPYWSITSNSTGQYLAAARNGGTIWYSTDYGNTWNQPQTSLTYNWYSVSSNSTGQYLIAVARTGGTTASGVFYSTDYGNTWTQLTYLGTNSFVSVKMNYNGNISTILRNIDNVNNGIPIYVSLNASN